MGEVVDRINLIVFIACVRSQEVIITSVVLPSKLESWVDPSVREDKESIEKSNIEFIFVKWGFIVEGNCSVKSFVWNSVVSWPLILSDFQSSFVGISSEAAFALNTCIEIEFVAIVLMDSIVVVDLVALVFESEVKSVSVSEGEPEFEFLIALGYFAFFGGVETFFEGDGWSGSLFGCFEDQFVGEEVIIENRVIASFEVGPRLWFEWISFAHLNK